MSHTPFARTCLTLLLCAFPAVISIATVPSTSHAADEATIDELLDATDDIARGASSHGKTSMHVKTKHYERTIEMEVWTRGTEDSLVRILSPAKEAGTCSLKVGDNMWNYLPKIDRTMKISGAALSGNWMGSHITNDDLVKGSRMREDYTSTMTAKPNGGDQNLYIIELVPKPDAPVVWGKVVLQIRPDKMPLKIEYFDEKSTLIRTMSFLDIKEIGGRSFPSVMRVEPAEDPGEFTEIRYADMQFDVELEDRLFTLQSLKK
jgi:outer membrane lipoprotein-sorting protein